MFLGFFCLDRQTLVYHSSSFPFRAHSLPWLNWSSHFHLPATGLYHTQTVPFSISLSWNYTRCAPTDGNLWKSAANETVLPKISWAKSLIILYVSHHCAQFLLMFLFEAAAPSPALTASWESSVNQCHNWEPVKVQLDIVKYPARIWLC